ncbi:MAG: PEP-CTERM sorting domain-containing protein [Phycisphaerae bacterium]
MVNKSSLKLVSAAAMAVAVVTAFTGIPAVQASTVTSIGISFGTDNVTVTTVTASDQLSSTQSAGVVPQTNWNNENYSDNNSGNLTNNQIPVSALNSTDPIVNSAGAITGVTGSWAAFVAYDNTFIAGSGSPDPNNGNQLLTNGGLYGATSSQTSYGSLNSLIINLTNIPYAEYDVYVYTLVGHSGDVVETAIGTTTTTGTPSYPVTFTPGSATGDVVYETSPNPIGTGYIDGTTNPFTFTRAISASETSPTAGGDYAEFTNITGTSFAVAAQNYSGHSPAINGIQIVPVAVVPEPAPLALVAAGGLGLLLVGRKRKFR